MTMSLTPLLAIAHLSVRQAIRSKLAASLLLLASGTVVFLPIMLRDDGTLEGRYRVLLEYTLNVSFALLVGSALWSACAGISTDAVSRRLHLITVKPVGTATLWFGHWLGLTLLHGGLLLFVWTVMLGQISWRMPLASAVNGSAVGNHAIAIGATSRVLHPEPARDAAEVANETAMPHEPIGPARTRTFRFSLPRTVSMDHNAILELRFVSSEIRPPGQSVEVPLHIDIGGEAIHDRDRLRGHFTAGSTYRIEPVNLQAADGNQLYVAVRNMALDPPVTILFHEREGLRLRVPQSGPLRNHARALLLLVVRLGFFVAVGLTAGALFSFPVAAFIGAFWLLFASLAGYIQSILEQGMLVVPHEGAALEPALAEQLILVLFRLFDIILWPLRFPQTIPRLGANELISGWETVISVATLMLLYVGVPALIGMLALRRRELGNIQ